MKLLLTVLITVSLSLVACKTTTTPVKPSIVDTPNISAQDAIGIAKQHALQSTDRSEAIIARAINMNLTTSGWSAQYDGKGKWTVDLLSKVITGVMTYYRWSVFENTNTAVFLGTQ